MIFMFNQFIVSKNTKQKVILKSDRTIYLKLKTEYLKLKVCLLASQ